MVRTLLKRSAILLLVLLAAAFPAAAFEHSEYKYLRTIDTTGIREPVWVSLDASLLSRTESQGKDIRLSGPSELPYHVVFERGTGPVPITSIEASSTQPGSRGVTYLPENMLDGTSSYYQNDFVRDQGLTTLLLGLPGIYKVEEIRFTFVEAPLETNISAVIDGRLIHLSSSRTSTARLNSVSTNVLQVSLRHAGTIKISSVEVLGETGGKILFLPATDEVLLYYGRPADPGQRYDTSTLFTDSTTRTLLPSGEESNPSFIADAEGGLEDNCPGFPNPDQADRDQDGVGDACDNCPFAKNKDQLDSDKDGIGNSCDNCPHIHNPDQLDRDLDTIGWVCDDDDGDGVTNDKDNCAGYNPDQQDVDRDGIGDLCEDDDGDGVVNYLDLCPTTVDPSNLDTDKDGVGDACDNCPDLSNSRQQDADNDGIGDACEDRDADGVPDSIDNCPGVQNPDQLDWDSDGLGDLCDNCPEHRNPGQQDIDRDGKGDACDTEESRILENSTVVWSIMILAAIAIIGMAFFLRTNTKK